MNKLILVLGVLVFLPLVSGFNFVEEDFEDGNYNGWVSLNGSTLAINTVSPLSDVYDLHVTGSQVSGGRGAIFNSSFNQTLDNKLNLSFLYSCVDITGDQQCFIGYDNDDDGISYRTLLRFFETENVWEWYNASSQWTSTGNSNRIGVNISMTFDNEYFYSLVIDGVTILTDEPRYMNNVTPNYLFFKSGFSSSATDFYVDNILLGGITPFTIEVSARDVISGSLVNDFSSSIYYPNGSLLFSDSTSGYNILFNMSGKPEGNYSLTFVSLTHENKNATVEYLNISLAHEFSTRNVPAVEVTIKDEENNSLITDVVEVSFIGVNNSFDYVTSNGSLYIQNLSSGSYDVLFTSVNYGLRSYSIVLDADAYVQVNAFLIPDGADATVFTFKDKNNGAELEGVVMSVETFIAGVYSTVAVLTSDVSGASEFEYADGVTYRFTAVKSGYENKQFVLSPVLFTAYTINLESSEGFVGEGDFSGVGLVILPDKYFNNANASVSLTFLSPDGEFVSYGFNASFGDVSVTGIGVLVGGSTLSGTLEVINASLTDRVRLDIFYNLSSGVSKEFSYFYFVVDATNDNTWSVTVGDDYGLGVFERLLIVTLTVLVVAGMITMFSNVEAGGVTALFVWGFFVWTKFISFWYVATSVIVIVIVLMWRSTK